MSRPNAQNDSPRTNDMHMQQLRAEELWGPTPPLPENNVSPQYLPQPIMPPIILLPPPHIYQQYPPPNPAHQPQEPVPNYNVSRYTAYARSPLPRLLSSNEHRDVLDWIVAANYSENEPLTRAALSIPNAPPYVPPPPMMQSPNPQNPGPENQVQWNYPPNNQVQMGMACPVYPPGFAPNNAVHPYPPPPNFIRPEFQPPVAYQNPVEPPPPPITYHVYVPPPIEEPNYELPFEYIPTDPIPDYLVKPFSSGCPLNFSSETATWPPKYHP